MHREASPGRALVRSAVRRLSRDFIAGKVALDIQPSGEGGLYRRQVMVHPGPGAAERAQYRGERLKITIRAHSDSAFVTLVDRRQRHRHRPEADLPRVCEKGFTGENGSKYGLQYRHGPVLCAGSSATG